MTIESEGNFLEFPGNGSDTAFNLTNLHYFEKNDLLVWVRTDSDGSLAAKVLDTDYSIAGTDTEAGSITMNTAPASGETLVVVRKPDFLQSADYPAGGSFPSEQHEDALDKLTELCLYLKWKVDRAVVLADGAADVDMEIPAGSKSQVLALDTTGGLTLRSVDGASWFIQANAPSDTTGADGDAFLDAASGDVYLKDGGTWGSATGTLSGPPPGVTWGLDSETTMVDPGSGDFRFNNATIASVTAIAFSANSAETGNPDVSAWVASWNNPTNASGKATLIAKKVTDPDTFAVFNVTAVVDNTSWLRATVTHVASIGTFSASDVFAFEATLHGSDGAGNVTSVFTRSGAVVPVASDYDADQIDYEGTPTNFSAGTADVEAAFAGVDIALGLRASSMAIQVFITSGTWTKPAGLIAALVFCTGGGGGGGASTVTTSTTCSAGGGGGGGGTAIKLFVAADLSATETVTIGAGGAGGSPSADNGDNGSLSEFGTHLDGDGGNGGTFASDAVFSRMSPAVDGGTASGGNLNLDGGPGGSGWFGWTESDVNNAVGGQGGPSFWGGGARQARAQTTVQDGNAPGSGGAGGPSIQNVSGTPGGDGADGIVVVIEFIG